MAPGRVRTATSPKCKIHSISVLLPSLPLGAGIFVPEQMGKAVSELRTPTLPALVLLWVPDKGSLSVYLILFFPVSTQGLGYSAFPPYFSWCQRSLCRLQVGSLVRDSLLPCTFSSMTPSCFWPGDCTSFSGSIESQVLSPKCLLLLFSFFLPWNPCYLSPAS